MILNYIISMRNNHIFIPSKLDLSMKKLPNLFYLKNKNNVKLSYYIFIPQNSSKFLIIWSHENKSNAYEYNDFLQNLSNILCCIIIIYDYQGYGFSEGVCSENNCYDDLETIVNFVLNKYGVLNKSIYLVGHGFGTATVINYISKNDWQNPVILISPFKSIFEIARETDKYDYLFEMAKHFVDLNIIDVFNSMNKLNKIKCSAKIIHGKNNNFIKIKQAKEIYNLLPNKKLKPQWVNDCGHYGILSKINFKELFDDILISGK